MVSCYQLVSTVIISISLFVKNLKIGTTYNNYFTTNFFLSSNSFLADINLVMDTAVSLFNNINYNKSKHLPIYFRNLVLEREDRAYLLHS